MFSLASSSSSSLFRHYHHHRNATVIMSSFYSSSCFPHLQTQFRHATLSQYYKQKQQYLVDMNPELDLQDHTWDSGQHYCHLCCEPFQDYLNHRGKREHMTIELFFEVICEYARDWRPRDVIENYHRGNRTLRVKKLRKFYQKRGRKENLPLLLNEEEMMRVSSTSHNKNNSSYYFDDPSFMPFQKILDYFETEQRQRRNSTHAIARLLVERGALYLGPKQWNHESLSSLNMARLGELVLFEWVHPPIQRLMPHAVAGQVSAFSQQCTGYYNLGSVFDFLGFSALIDPRDLPNYVGKMYDDEGSGDSSENESPYGKQSRLKPVGDYQKQMFNRSLGSNNNNNNNINPEKPYDTANQKSLGVQDVLSSLSRTHSKDSFTSEVDFSLSPSSPLNSTASQVEMMYWHKGIVLRNILGQIRWAMDSNPIHNNAIGQQLFDKEPHMIILCQELLQGIICESVFLRIAEYISRAEYAWRQLGCPVYNNHTFLEMARDSQAKLVFRRGAKINELNMIKMRQKKVPVTKSNDANFRLIKENLMRSKLMSKKNNIGNAYDDDFSGVDPQLEQYVQFVEARKRLRQVEESRARMGAKVPLARGASNQHSSSSGFKMKHETSFTPPPAAASGGESIFEKFGNVRKQTAADKVLEIVQGSCHDGVAALMGSRKGSLDDFSSGGAMQHFLDDYTYRNFTSHVQDQADLLEKSKRGEKSSLAPLKNEIMKNLTMKELNLLQMQKEAAEREHQQKLKKIAEKKKQTLMERKEGESDADVEARIKRAEALLEKQLKKEEEQEKQGSGSVSNFKRKAGSTLSPTAERLLAEASFN